MILLQILIIILIAVICSKRIRKGIGNWVDSELSDLSSLLKPKALLFYLILILLIVGIGWLVKHWSIVFDTISNSIIGSVIRWLFIGFILFCLTSWVYKKIKLLINVLKKKK